MKRILFVDDDARELRRLREMFADMSLEWTMEFAESGEQAMERMTKEPADVILTNLLLPGMDGEKLLSLVRERYPQAVRIALCDESSRDTVMRVAGLVHQDLSLPCEPTEVKASIERALVLRDLLEDPSLKRLVSQVLSLPSMPDLYLKLLEELRGDDPDTGKISEIISRDMGMCAKMLQLVNSASFGLTRRIDGVAEAVQYLGVETVKALMLSLQIFALFERVKMKEFSFADLWRHGWIVGTLSRDIAAEEKVDARVKDQAFLAGLLHDVGKLVLVTGVPDKYQVALRMHRQMSLPLWKTEHDIFGSTHAEAGAYLLALWGVSDPIVEAVALHHRPLESPGEQFSPLTAVHVANALEHELRGEAALCPIDMDYLAQVGLTDKVPLWTNLARELVAKDAKQG